jgi:predicted dehydrogenase
MSSTLERSARARRAGRDGLAVRVAVVGLGYWGPNLVRNLHEVDGADAVVVCDARSSAVDTIRRRFPALRGTTRFEDVLADPEVDAVAIATPVSTHFPLAEAALQAGKHVFVEKPLAATSAEAESLLRLASRLGLVLMPGHTFLYSPPVVTIERMLRAGELGEIYFVSTSRVNLGLHQTDVSVVWDLGPHDFSILQYWLGESPSAVSALSRGCIIPGTPDVTFVNLEYRSRAIAHVELSWLAPSKLRRTTIVGSEKMIVYDDTSNEPVRVFDSGVVLPDPESFGEYRLTYRTGDIVSPNIGAAEPLGLEMEDFCAAIRTGQPPRSSASIGLEVVRVIEAVDRSLELDGAKVRIADSSHGPGSRGPSDVAVLGLTD